MIRLIGIDVDGTLVGASGEIEPAIWLAAQRARAAGIHLALCSGRAAFGRALDYARQLDDAGWHIFQNGASIVHPASGRSRSANLPSDAVRALITEARTTGRLLELYSDSDYATEIDSLWAREHAALLGVPFVTRPFESLEGTVVRAQWVVSPEDAAHVLAHPPQGLEIAESTSPLMPDVRFVGLTRDGISKGSAMRAIATEYGIALEEVMYVGDAGNDISAMRVVGFPVAMGNAPPDVRGVAKRTVDHVDRGGLVEALEIAMEVRAAH